MSEPKRQNITQIEVVAPPEPLRDSSSDFLSTAEEDRLRAMAIQRERKYRGSYSQRAVVELALCTGAKVNELVKLSCGDLMLTPNGASIRISSDVVPRVLPLSDEMQNYFAAFLKRKEAEGEATSRTSPLVCSQNGKRLSLRGWQSAWGLACKHAGLIDDLGKPLYNLETARRTVGRRLYAMRKNPHHVQAWLGLDITSNADRYRPDELQFGVDALRSLIDGSDRLGELGTFEQPSLDLAMRYYNGTIGVMNRLLAKRLFLQVSAEDPRREMFVARSLTSGRCMFPLDEARGEAKARKVIGAIRELAEENDPFSVYMLASAYDEGLAVERDLERSNELYAKAVELGWETAMNNFGLQHFFGKGVSQNDEKAFGLFLQGASMHEASSMFNLAFMYQNGIGTKQDIQKAVRWLRKGALTGEARCMNNLSYCYFHGIGVPKDEAMGERWFCMSGILPPSDDGTVSPRKPVLIRLAG